MSKEQFDKEINDAADLLCKMPHLNGKNPLIVEVAEDFQALGAFFCMSAADRDRVLVGLQVCKNKKTGEEKAVVCLVHPDGDRMRPVAIMEPNIHDNYEPVYA